MSSSNPAVSALLVDDEAYFRRFVGQLLFNRGIAQVIEARDGEEALSLFSVTGPTLVILDINMPRLNGIETLHALRKMAPDVPIIMLTSIADETMVERCVDEGATFFIRKDLPAQELMAELDAVLAELNRARSES